jgi:hypothetical protein
MQPNTTLLITGIALGLSSFNAQATLTPETANGTNLVYSSISNTTWTQDANLLGTLEADTILQYGDDSSLITAIINANSGVIYDTANTYDNGTYTLTANDFGTGGTVNWWAAQAFVHYLNTINYGGSNQWSLPITTIADPSNSSSTYTSQLEQLYKDELSLGSGGVFGDYSTGTKNISPFTNIQATVYWTGTEYAAYPYYAWIYDFQYGIQYSLNKDTQYYAWAASPGQVPVPITGSVWLFVTGLISLFGLNRKRELARF